MQPFAPHLSEELWEKLSRLGEPFPSLAWHPWPKFDPALLVESLREIPVQVSGKLRGRVLVPAEATAAELEAAARACETVKPYLEGKQVRKVIVVPGKMINLVAG